MMLGHSLSDLVYYDVGLIMNLSLSPKGRKLMTKLCLPKLCEVLQDSEIENIELSKVVCKCITNFCKEKQFWTNDLIEQVDETVSTIGEDLDSIVEMAKPEEKEVLLDLRKLTNDVINNLPEQTFDCPKSDCGRKFKNQEELDSHMSRRHG